MSTTDPTTGPRTRCRSRRVNHVYDVQVQDRPGGRWVTVGRVKRFGSLPSMQSWRAIGDGEGQEWTRPQDTRAAAIADLLKEHLDRS